MVRSLTTIYYEKTTRKEKSKKKKKSNYQFSAGLTISTRNTLKYNKEGRKNGDKQFHSPQMNSIHTDFFKFKRHSVFAAANRDCSDQSTNGKL